MLGFEERRVGMNRQFTRWCCSSSNNESNSITRIEMERPIRWRRRWNLADFRRRIVFDFKIGLSESSLDGTTYDCECWESSIERSRFRLRCCPPGIKESSSTKCVMMEWRAGHGVTVFERERSAFSRTKVLDLERSGANDSRAIGENGSSLPSTREMLRKSQKNGIRWYSCGIFSWHFKFYGANRGVPARDQSTTLEQHREQLRNFSFLRKALRLITRWGEPPLGCLDDCQTQGRISNYQDKILWLG